jgi:hypothetical protein
LPVDEEITSLKVVNGVLITKRLVNEGDKCDG